jgi:hypothetical protein
MMMASLLVLTAVALLTNAGIRGRGWRRAGPIFLIGGVVLGVGSTEIMAALLLALIVIDIILGSFTGAERLVNLRVRTARD